MKQTICDRCKYVGSYARISWDLGINSILIVNKDLCKICFEQLFPEWMRE